MPTKKSLLQDKKESFLKKSNQPSENKTFEVRKRFKFIRVKGLPMERYALLKQTYEAMGFKFYFRETIFGHEIICGKHKFAFSSKKGKANLKYLYIYGMVKRDALKYKSQHKIKKTKWYPSIKWNENVDPGTRRIVGYDINQAYWKVANMLGIISDNTFYRGQDIPEKQILLSSLSTLGSDKRYSIYNKTKVAESREMIWKGDDDLKEIYKKIRSVCFRHMQYLASGLGDDFVCYKTDCIYFLYSPENDQFVKEYLDNKGLDAKRMKGLENLSTGDYKPL